jgi:aspartyl protease family protein
MGKLFGLGVIALLCAASVIPLVQRLDAAPPPVVQVAQPATSSADRVVTINGDGSGHFFVDALVESRPVPMLVDTGASIVALTAEDGARLGLRPQPGVKPMRLSTANGEIMADRVRLSQVRIGSIIVRDVDAVVMPKGALAKSLLGMSFLKRIDRFAVDRNRLTLVD